MSEVNEEKKGCSPCGCLVLLGILAVVALVAYLLLAPRFFGKGKTAELESMATELNERFQRTAAFFTEEQQALLADTTFCTEDYDYPNIEISAVYLDHLQRFTDSTYKISVEDKLGFLTTFRVEDIPVFDKVHKKRKLFFSASSIREQHAQELIVVFIIDEFIPPQSFGNDSFISGLLSGQMVLFDMKNAIPLCDKPFVVESGNAIEFKDRELDLKDTDDHLMDELAERMVTRGSIMLREISPYMTFRDNVLGRDNDF